MNSFYSRGWNAWHAWLVNRKRQQELVGRILNRMSNALLWAAFRPWHADVVQHKKKQAFLRAMVLRMLNSLTSMALNSWKRTLALGKQEEHKRHQQQ